MPKRRRIEIEGFTGEDTRTVRLIVDSENLVLRSDSEPFARNFAQRLGTLLGFQVCSVLQEKTEDGYRIARREILRG